MFGISAGSVKILMKKMIVVLFVFTPMIVKNFLTIKKKSAKILSVQEKGNKND